MPATRPGGHPSDGADPTVVFVGHNASRTGAPLVLLKIEEWLTRHHVVASSLTILGGGGPLVPDYQRLGPTLVLQEDEQPGSGRLRRWFLAAACPTASTLIWSNTVWNGAVLDELRRLLPGAPVVSHLHELEYVTSLAGERSLALTLERTTHVVVPNDVVGHFGRTRLGLDPSRLSVVPEPLRLPTPPPATMHELRARARHDLGISPPTFLVGSVGTIEWRKGPDLLVPLAHLVARRTSTPVHYLWLDTGALDTRDQLRSDIDKAGLGAVIEVHSPVADPTSYYAAFDAFLLLSREDPQPLALIEATALGIPALCFRSSGGGPDYVARGSGRAVDYLDLDAMADALVDWVGDHAEAAAIGAVGRQQAQAHSMEVVGPRIAAIVHQIAQANPMKASLT